MSAELPIGVTIPGGKIGSIKTGATEIGKRGANYRTGESARTSQRAEHPTTRMSGATWNVARAQQDYRGPVATMQLLEKNQRLLKELKTRQVTKMKRAAAVIGR